MACFFVGTGGISFPMPERSSSGQEFGSATVSFGESTQAAGWTMKACTARTVPHCKRRVAAWSRAYLRSRVATNNARDVLQASDRCPAAGRLHKVKGGHYLRPHGSVGKGLFA